MIDTSPHSLWNSLEIAKLIADILIPVAVFGLGFVALNIEKRIEKRIDDASFRREWLKELYTDIFTSLDVLYCAFNYVGRWRTFGPEDIVAAKRRLDSSMFSHEPLFSKNTLATYDAFISACFLTTRGRGLELQIRANVEMYAESAYNWDDSYSNYYVPPAERIRRKEFLLLYNKFRENLFRDMGLTL